MQETLDKIKKEFIKGLDEVKEVLQLEELEQKFFSRKSGEMTEAMKSLKKLSGDAKAEFGKLANEVKKELEDLYGKKKNELEKNKMGDLADSESIDVTQPNLPKKENGSLHPETLVLREMEEVSRNMGFIVEDGPELDSDYFSFEALNIPDSHPARDSQDTFYIKGHPNWCMRPHVSNMQVRMIQKYGTPLRVAYPGRTFRNEATDASHDHTFYQFEALVIDKDINVGNLIGIIKELLSGLYKKDVEVRLRPGYFPFVEPGFEMDMKCLICEGQGCGACGHSGWVETLGCGLVHPKVLEAAGLDPKEWSGLAFGMGLTRLAMQKYRIEDIRHLQSGDLRFLKQF
ncbi:MAG: phenylalanine--tRNA ligase subunit alpha [Candidatus Magasanikbacteria bacterium]|jgi:phenylalanyl-tRNA synthetase alpha chain|nr:phenylalanine--tRNA ligase subunit alpha [Candidatus Magasanikbacteria bacterium]MBT4314548.1 phenylalanine--tRNA ligase subunit alpha [Candidatus Magasanikbacteria bacterium]MBT4547446.1 phenylalanine--tRNA ligase subunit alpha [Candidatus Magasanikbacteria bacterium]MBT6819147.1 phenylalanine--tRNA ligase subunit alpha [Candidatus Magasanikbacteria bacterium]